MEATADNPIQQELSAALNALDEEQRIEILALMWLGRGDLIAANGVPRSRRLGRFITLTKRHTCSERHCSPIIWKKASLLSVPRYRMHPIADKAEIL